MVEAGVMVAAAVVEGSEVLLVQNQSKLVRSMR
jgi:hypothetical protein